MPDKEQVYDEQINPLMTQIIDICMKHGIAMFCDFAIPTEEDPDLCCSTVMPDGEGQHPQLHRLIIAVKRQTTNIDEFNVAKGN